MYAISSCKMSNAQDFCKEVEKKKTLIGALTDIATSPMKLIGDCLDKLGSHTDTTTIIKNNIENVVTSSIVSIVENKCSNEAAIRQANEVDNTECIRLLNCGNAIELAQSLKQLGFSEAGILKALNDNNTLCSNVLSRDGQVTQENSLTSQQSCTLDGALELLSHSKLDSNLMAVFEKVQEAKGLMSGSSSTTNSCNMISNKIDSSTYSSAKQECSNVLKLDQGNVARCASGSVNQQNRADMLSECLVSQGVTIKNEQEGNTSLEAKESLESSATGIDSTFLLMLAACGVVAFLIINKLR